jgi:hypothetical protein
MIKSSLLFAGGALALTATDASAGQLVIDIEIPRLSVAEYHKPYVAGWLEKENSDGSYAGNLFVWYDVKKRDGAGQSWLKDLRQWWRKSGRELTLPINGVTSATRAPGRHTVFIDTANVSGLKAGSYVLMVEAARETGGREVVKVPFTYSPGNGGTVSGKGQSELGTVTLTYKP